MATQRKKSAKVETVDDESYSNLEMYCIWLHEYYESLRRAGFDDVTALGSVIDKDSYPDWVVHKNPTIEEIRKHIEEEEED